jgi:hypothetical protein
MLTTLTRARHGPPRPRPNSWGGGKHANARTHQCTDENTLAHTRRAPRSHPTHGPVAAFRRRLPMRSNSARTSVGHRFAPTPPISRQFRPGGAHTLTSMHPHTRTQATSSSPPPAMRAATSTAAASPTPPRTPTATSSAWARSTGTTNRARRSPTTVRADEPPSAYSRSACRAAGWWLPSPHKAVLGLEGPCWSTARQSPALITQTPSLHTRAPQLTVPVPRPRALSRCQAEATWTCLRPAIIFTQPCYPGGGSTTTATKVSYGAPHWMGSAQWRTSNSLPSLSPDLIPVILSFDTSIAVTDLSLRAGRGVLRVLERMARVPRRPHLKMRSWAPAPPRGPPRGFIIDPWP